MRKNLIAELTVPQEILSGITPLLNNLAIKSRGETGCIRYDVFRKQETIVIIETWADAAALEVHKTQPHFTDVVQFIDDRALTLTVTELFPL